MPHNLLRTRSHFDPCSGAIPGILTELHAWLRCLSLLLTLFLADFCPMTIRDCRQCPTSARLLEINPLIASISQQFRDWLSACVVSIEPPTTPAPGTCEFIYAQNVWTEWEAAGCVLPLVLTGVLGNAHSGSPPAKY